MAFYDASSRYLVDDTGRYATPKPNTRSSRYSLYVVKAGDTLERIALKSLGSTRRAWEIADLNPQVKFPLQLTVGDTLRVPF